MPKFSETSSSPLLAESSHQLRLESVSVTTPLGTKYLLEDISFKVSRGDRVAIVGSSGAGKSTLLRSLNRLIEPVRGSIYWENQDYRQMSAIAWRRQVTLVLQESRLLGMSVREALAYPLKLRSIGTSEIGKQVNYGMEILKIPQQWLDRTELQLSMGQRQLVAIARALIIQPKILLLDEPTSALDTGRARQVLDVLMQVNTSQQMTILMANHQLELAEEFSTQVIHLQKGKLLQDALTSSIDWANLRQSSIEAKIQESEEWSE
ncbi:cobalt ABC transporter [Oscillatoriales cyanobacterium USR001]|nr:cobalt ABC transporter [Oscillatoriales cyanobacterium USR001]